MKVGIVGDATRGVAWEQHLRPHSIVREVELCPTLDDLDKVDACFLIDESDDNLDTLLKAIQKGFNCFFIARQPTDFNKLDKIHRAAREAGVLVQFAHWPTLAPATRWMMTKVTRPTYIHINKEISRSQIINAEMEFQNHWIDEFGLCLKWIDSGVHNIEAKAIRIGDKQPIAIQLFLRFDNGASASIHIYTGASESNHKRVIANKHAVLECNVPDQQIKLGTLGNADHLFFEKKSFDPSTAAEKAALLFLKSIQLNKETAYTSYDALRLALHIDKVNQRLKQFT